MVLKQIKSVTPIENYYFLNIKMHPLSLPYTCRMLNPCLKELIGKYGIA